MHTAKLTIWAAAIILAGGLTSRAAHADGISNDPNIVLHTVQGPGGGDPPSTTDGSSDTDPLILIDHSGSPAFTYEGVDTDVFYVEIVPYNGETDATFQSEAFTCTDLAATVFTQSPPCEEVSPTQIPAVEYEFFGPFLNTDGGVQDDIVAGDTLNFDVPEPSAMFLLLGGLGSVFAFALRRRELARS